MADAGGEREPAASPDAAGEERGLTPDDARVESTSALTTARNEAPADSASTDDPAKLAVESPSRAIPPSKTAAPDPSST